MNWDLRGYSKTELDFLDKESDKLETLSIQEGVALIESQCSTPKFNVNKLMFLYIYEKAGVGGFWPHIRQYRDSSGDYYGISINGKIHPHRNLVFISLKISATFVRTTKDLAFYLAESIKHDFEATFRCYGFEKVKENFSKHFAEIMAKEIKSFEEGAAKQKVAKNSNG